MGATAHIDFIAAAYCAAAITIAALVAWVTLDYRTQQRALADLEMRGITRRSETAHSPVTMQQAKEDA